MSETGDHEQHPGPAQDDPINELVTDLFNLGKMWASHGLEIGKRSLEHSARTLEVTASALETISQRLTSEPPEAKE